MTLSAEDHIAIEQLYRRYHHAGDFSRPDEWADLFTVDGSWSMPGRDPIEGHEALRAFAASVGGGFRHWIANLVLEATPTGASGCAYLVMYSVGGDGDPKPKLSGIYNDELVKTDQGWRFASRNVTFD